LTVADHSGRRGFSAAAGSIRGGRPSAVWSYGFRQVSAALLCVAFIFCAGIAYAYHFPPLSGRVVDDANVIPAETKAAISAKLEQLDAKSGIQFVVATVNSLDGDEIEPYANALFRDWKLGESKKNNGVLLLVAPKQRKVRIEAGYGLEGTLTDALSKIIISNAMTPRFKTGDFGGGVARGVDDVITVLTTHASEWQKRPDLRLDRRDSPTESLTPWIVFGLFLLVIFLLLRSPGRRAAQSAMSGSDQRWGGGQQQGDVLDRGGSRWGPGARSQQGGALSNILSFLLGMLMSSGRGGGSDGWGGGGGGGGFSGGGGSSGGGGASGSW
jgi:uncharacterized protein